MKGFLKFVFALTALVTLTTAAHAQDATQTVTKAQLALQLVTALNLTLPTDFAQMSAEDQFQACVSLLAAKGITSFNGASANEAVTRTFLAQTLIVLAPNVPDTVVTDQDKIDYLVQQGVISGTGDAVTPAELVSALASSLVTGSSLGDTGDNGEGGTQQSEEDQKQPTYTPPDVGGQDAPEPPEPAAEKPASSVTK